MNSNLDVAMARYTTLTDVTGLPKIARESAVVIRRNQAKDCPMDDCCHRVAIGCPNKRPLRWLRRQRHSPLEEKLGRHWRR